MTWKKGETVRRALVVSSAVTALLIAFWPVGGHRDPAAAQAVTTHVRVHGSDALLVVHQVPDDALPDLSTPDLLGAVLDHPLVGELLGPGPADARIAAFRHRSAAFGEFLDRTDAATVIDELVDLVRRYGWPRGTTIPEARAAVLDLVREVL